MSLSHRLSCCLRGGHCGLHQSFVLSLDRRHRRHRFRGGGFSGFHGVHGFGGNRSGFGQFSLVFLLLAPLHLVLVQPVSLFLLPFFQQQHVFVLFLPQQCGAFFRCLCQHQQFLFVVLRPPQRRRTGPLCLVQGRFQRVQQTALLQRFLFRGVFHRFHLGQDLLLLTKPQRQRVQHRLFLHHHAFMGRHADRGGRMLGTQGGRGSVLDGFRAGGVIQRQHGFTVSFGHGSNVCNEHGQGGAPQTVFQQMSQFGISVRHQPLRVAGRGGGGGGRRRRGRGSSGQGHQDIGQGGQRQIDRLGFLQPSALRP